MLGIFALGTPEDPEKPVPEKFSGNVLPADMQGLQFFEDNYDFLKYVNILVSNFGTEEDVKQFNKAIDHHLIAEQFYLRRKFLEQYREVRKSHIEMVAILQRIIPEYYEKYALPLLNATNAMVALANDPQAKPHLKNGYYAYQRGINFYQKGYYANKFQYSQKIRYYIEAVEQFRLANRSAIRAIIEVKTPIVIKGAYQTQSAGDYLNNKTKVKISSYEQVRLALITLNKRPMLAQDDVFKLLERHQDNYARIYAGKESAFIEYLQNQNVSLNYYEEDASAEAKQNEGEN